MTDPVLTDEQWLVLDMLMRSRHRGVHRINRLEILQGQNRLPEIARLRLVMAALTMPRDLVRWPTTHDFEITDAGIQAYRRRFGDKPSPLADGVIYLLGPGKELQ